MSGLTDASRIDTLRPHPKELIPDFEIARRLHRKHGTSYYFATRFFPLPARQATWALYAFFRVPDEIVDSLPRDSPAEIAKVRSTLGQWRDDWRAALRNGTSDDAVLRVAAHVHHRYDIPPHYAESFLDAMEADLDTTRYATYDDLEKYMYGSAACVGLMMSHVIGFVDESEREVTLQRAAKLGYAMQLTNFLRDVDEDWSARRRIYLPLDELERFGVTENAVAERQFSDSFRELMVFQAERARRLYAEATEGVPNLRPHGRFAVSCAAALYGAILTKLEQQDWNPFAGRARTTKIEKVQLAWRARSRVGNSSR